MMTLNQRIYALVNRIPAGKVLSYGRVAQLLGMPHGARAVGWALRVLPDGTSVPWQRVVGKDGHLRTPQIDQTAAEQRARLNNEGITFDEAGRVDMARFVWRPSEWEVRDLLDLDDEADPESESESPTED